MNLLVRLRRQSGPSSLVLLTTAILVVGGCSGGSTSSVPTADVSALTTAGQSVLRSDVASTQDSPATTTPSPHLLSVVDLQSYAPGEEQLVWNATQSLIAECMARQGFEYQAIPLTNVAENREVAKAVDRLDPAVASVAGYHPNLVPQSAKILSAQDAYEAAANRNDESSARDARFTLALEGPDGGAGCVRQAYDRLYGSRPPMPELYRQLTGQMYKDLSDSVATDSSVVAATASWSSCMKAAGFAYSSPEQARASFDITQPLQQAELKTAIQDSQCRRDSDIYEVRRQAEDHFLRAWLEAHPGVLERLTAARAADVAASKAVLGVS